VADRFASEVCLAVSAGTPVPDWTREGLPLLPPLMAAADSLSHKLDRMCIDRTEAWLLRDRVGEVFEAAVVDVDDHRGTIVIDEPAVRARCDSPDLPLGERVQVRLVVADPDAPDVRFELATPG
jgi:exoribonuclease R